MFRLRAGWLVVALALGSVGGVGEGAGAPNRLTEAEKGAGWRLLFDGESSRGWRGFKQEGFPKQGWVVEDGCLKHQARGGGGDIVTEETFDDFEFSWEWRLGRGGNTGVKYFITEEREQAIGHEYQIIDDAPLAPGAKPGKGVTAGFYDVLAPTAWARARPAGEFNQSRIVVQGKHVEHWLNGLKTIEYELETPALLAAIGRSKFREVRGFGTKIRGRLLLQDHGGEVCFRNLKLRALPGP